MSTEKDFNVSNELSKEIKNPNVTEAKASTFLDILLALLKWNKDNESYVMFIVKNLHSGYNKINWTRTISKSPAIVQQANGSLLQEVSYLNPVNKKRTINFDEELLVIYFSILQHIHDHQIMIRLM